MSDQTNQKLLLLTAPQAARFLQLSEKTLWNFTRPRGAIPCVRVGRVVRYSRESLQKWIEESLDSSDGRGP